MAFTSILQALRVKPASYFAYYFSNGLHSTSGSNGDLSCDTAGNLWTREAVGPQVTADGGFSYQAVPADDTAVVRAAPGTVTLVSGFNDNAAPASAYLQIHNKAAALVLGDVPVYTFLITPLSSFEWRPSKGGRTFTVGITYGVSSTRDTYTVSVTPVFVSFEGYTT
jgi:hypothetical protein